MQFTGTELTLKRSVYTQSGFYGFAADITVDNTTGRYRFGLTGAAGAIEFVLDSGRLYYGSQFISTYRSFSEFSIEGQFDSGSVNIIKDGEALAYNATKSTGYIDYFYFSRANAGMGATFDVTVSGNSTPSYTITQQGYLLTSGQNGVTGYFVNQGAFPVKVFNSSIQATQNYGFTRLADSVARNGTGNFIYTGDWDNLDLSQPILTTFNTNYQDSTILFTITDARAYGKFVYLTGPTDFTFNNTGVLARDVTYINYSGGFATDAYQTSLVFRLKYVSGLQTYTGVWDLLTGVNPNNLVSLKVPGQFDTGMISGSGLFPPNSSVSFQVSHTIISGLSEGASLIISGNDVLNPISQTLSNP